MVLFLLACNNKALYNTIKLFMCAQRTYYNIIQPLLHIHKHTLLFRVLHYRRTDSINIIDIGIKDKVYTKGLIFSTNAHDINTDLPTAKMCIHTQGLTIYMP